MDCMYNFGEGFVEYCGSQDYELDTSPSSYYAHDAPGYYDILPDFQNEVFMDSPESDQENCMGYIDSNVTPLSSEYEWPKKVHQRTAANMRERRRMKSINDAFEDLRVRIPGNNGPDRRLSKVDTLRLAIRYISYLNDMVKTCTDGNRGTNARIGEREKIILKRPPTQESESWCFENGQAVIGHSLSVSKRNSEVSDNYTLSAKVWVPQEPTPSDLINLSSSNPTFMSE